MTHAVNTDEHVRSPAQAFTHKLTTTLLPRPKHAAYSGRDSRSYGTFHEGRGADSADAMRTWEVMRVAAASEQRTRPAVELDSMRLAVLTLSPKRLAGETSYTPRTLPPSLI
jgi:hypothetical protein